MTGEDLKNSILRQAMCGKLVEQRAAEGSSQTLLNSIGACAAAADDAPFDIPDSWRWSTLAEVADISLGKTPPRNEPRYWDSNDYPWVSIGDMVHGQVIFEVKEGVSEAAYKECFSGDLVPAGTLIMSFKLTIGKTSILGMDALHNEAIISILPKYSSDDYVRDFFMYILPYAALHGETKNAIKGKTLNKKSLSSLLIPIPPLEEQERIVAKLDEVMPLIEEYGRLQEQRDKLDAELPEKLQNSILRQAMCGKLIEQKDVEGSSQGLLDSFGARVAGADDAPFDIPDSWCWSTLAEVADISLGKTPPRNEPRYWDSSDYPWVSIADMKHGQVISETKEGVSEAAYAECFPKGLVPAGTLIMSFKLTIGKTSILGMDALHNEAIISILPRYSSDDYVRDFFMYVLPYAVLNGETKNAIKGKTLNKKSLSSLLIPIPPLGEQKRIVTKLDEVIPLIESLGR